MWDILIKGVIKGAAEYGLSSYNEHKFKKHIKDKGALATISCEYKRDSAMLPYNIAFIAVTQTEVIFDYVSGTYNFTSPVITSVKGFRYTQEVEGAGKTERVIMRIRAAGHDYKFKFLPEKFAEFESVLSKVV